jgi:hypothetical protein
MTDEERQKLCDRLRHLPAYTSVDGMRAADEIERLAALVQSDVEPPDYIPIGGAGNGA